MSVARARALRSLQSSLRHSGARATPRASGRARTQLAVGRRYASGGAGEHAAPGSDLPWALGAIVVTIPTCYYLWPSATHADGGHHGGHGEHGEHEEHAEAHEEKEDEASAEPEESTEEPKEEAVEQPSQDEQPAQDTTEEQEQSKENEETAKASGSEGEAQPNAPDANKASSAVDEPEEKESPDHKGNTAGVQFKGKMKEDAAGMSDTRKREPDSKGAFKNRIDSGARKELSGMPGPDEAEADSASNTGDMASKQFGLSTTATRHSTQIDQDPEKSKKGEGTPETAKTSGTVDPNRPQV